MLFGGCVLSYFQMFDWQELILLSDVLADMNLFYFRCLAVNNSYVFISISNVLSDMYLSYFQMFIWYELSLSSDV